MGRRVPNPRRIKINRPYTVDAIARALNVHKNTVRQGWLKHGLVAIDDHRPTLIRGQTLRQFLEARRAKAKRTCPPGHFYCMHCRAPRLPAGRMADYIPDAPTTGNLKGLCPDCDGWMYRRASLAKMDALRKDLDIQLQQADRRIGESTAPSVNCDLEGDSQT
jgi:hypothetical protein